MRPLLSSFEIHGSIEVGKQIGIWCIRYQKTGNTSWVYFGSSVCVGGNAISSGHGSTMGKGTRAPLTGHGSRVGLSVTSIKAEGLTPRNYISGLAMGETVTFDGSVSGEDRC